MASPLRFRGFILLGATLVACGPQLEEPSVTGSSTSGPAGSSGSTAVADDASGELDGPPTPPPDDTGDPVQCLNAIELGPVPRDVIRFHRVDSEPDGVDEIWGVGFGGQSTLLRMEVGDGSWAVATEHVFEESFAGFGSFDDDPAVDALIMTETELGEIFYSFHPGNGEGFDPELVPLPWPSGIVASIFDIDRDGHSDVLRYDLDVTYELWLGDPVLHSVHASDVAIEQGDRWEFSFVQPRDPAGWLVTASSLEPGGFGGCPERKLESFELQGDALVVGNEAPREGMRLVDAWDHDGDGRPDPLTTHCVDGQSTFDLAWRPSQADGTFGMETLAEEVEWARAPDIDGNGTPDLLWSGADGAVMVRMGAPGGFDAAMGSTVSLPGLYTVWWPIDHDGDGREHVLLVSLEGIAVLVGEGQCV